MRTYGRSRTTPLRLEDIPTLNAIVEAAARPYEP